MFWRPGLFTITVQKSFTARHRLTMADGTVEESHSHHWLVKAAVSTDELDKTGLALDFHALQAMLRDVIEPFENTDMETLDCFKGTNPSAEVVAKYIYDRIGPMLPSHAELRYIKVKEADNCWAKYSK